ncbi:MAG: hypothetical protein EXQ54_00135 [Acidobacteria bacterium]|nr:hypothetical protein [Acidobacteriota bacterium]
MDRGVFAYLAAICLGTGVLFGLAPALHISKTDVNEVLKEGGRLGTAGVRARRWTGALMVGELALTVVLLAGAAFMMRNFVTLYSLDLGIDTSKLLVMRLALPERKYPALEQRLAFYQRIEERLKSNSRIEAVTIASNAPMQGGFLRRLTLDGKPIEQGQQAPNVTMLTVDPRYFETIGAPLVRGRGLTDEDGMTGRESAIINQRFAQLHFPNEDPVGRRITLSIDLQGGAAPDNGIPLSLTATIVGIAPNVRQRDFQQPDPDPVAYLPFRTDPHLRLDVRDLRLHRAGVVGSWPVCRHGVFSNAANAGGRSADGAWRAVEPGDVVVPAAVVRAAGDRTDARGRGCVWRREVVPEHGAPGPDHGRRPADHRGNCTATDGRRRRRLCLAGSARDPS